MADTPGALLRPPLAYVQSPSYSKEDQEQGGSIEDAPDLVPPADPPYTPTDPGTEASCLERYQYNLGTCYAGALAAVNEERRTLINGCYADHQGAIDAAMAAVEEAEKDVVAMQKGLYQPAEPLILTLPVAHCSVRSYAIGDEVLIDFPEREPGATGMGVWQSARVIGWASNTKNCLQMFIVNYFVYYEECKESGALEQTVEEGGDGTPVKVKHYYNYTTTDYIGTLYHYYDLLFYHWSDNSASLTHQAFNVQRNIGFHTGILRTPQKIYLIVLYHMNYSTNTQTAYLWPCTRSPNYNNSPALFMARFSGVTELENWENPYNEPEFRVVYGIGGWTVLGAEDLYDGDGEEKPFFARRAQFEVTEDGPVPGTGITESDESILGDSPAELVLWSWLLRNMPVGTLECCTFARSGIVHTTDGFACMEYTRTGFGGSVYDYM